jgi:hypothetical protein
MASRTGERGAADERDGSDASGEPDEWRRIARHKLAELDEQIARAQAAREAISHGLRCRHEDVTQCPNFEAGITARLAGQPLRRLIGSCMRRALPPGHHVERDP